jgi:hypothetical protein
VIRTMLFREDAVLQELNAAEWFLGLGTFKV